MGDAAPRPSRAETGARTADVAPHEDASMAATLETPVSDTQAETAPARKRGGGPKTPEGRDKCRWNAMKHGLCARTLTPEGLAANAEKWAADLADELAPVTPLQVLMVAQMGLAAARLERCAQLSAVDLQRVIDRAGLCWDDDRRMAVEDLAIKLPKDPARVSRALRRCKQGSDWLIERWEGLAMALRAHGRWTEAQRSLAFDMLGVAPELRDGDYLVPAADDEGNLAALIMGELNRLRDRRERTLVELDSAEREMTAWGMPLEEDAATARLRKYESACRRDLNRSLAELRRSQSGGAATTAEPSHRREPSAAASEYAANRSRLVKPAASPAPVEDVEVEEIEEVEEVEAADESPTPAARWGNRRARREKAKRARQAARAASR